MSAPTNERSTPLPSARRRLSGIASLAGLALLSACGDDLATSASASGSTGDASSSGAMSSTATATASATATTSASGGDSDSATSGGETSAGTTATTSDSDSGVTGTSTSTSTSTSASTSTSDSDSGGLASCVDADLPYAGPLCGPDDLPCAVTIDEAVEAAHHFRNEAPAIAFDDACDPEVLFSIAEGGYFGYFARRVGADAWEVEATPFALARVGAAHDHGADTPLALAYDGAFGTSLWSRSGGVWGEVAPLPGQAIASAHGFVRDPAGPLHAALVTDGNAPRHAVYDGAWSSADLGEQAPASAALTVDVDGQPHVTFWSSKDLTWKLYYAAPPEPAEEILALGSNVLEIQRQGIAAIPGDNDPLASAGRVLAAIQQGGGLHTLVLASRLAPGKWESAVIVAEDDKDASLCAGPPAEMGDTCDYDYVRYRPLEIVASAGGDVRFFYGKVHHLGTLVAECVEFPFPQCWWAPSVDQSTAELRIGWPTDQEPASVTLLDGAFISDMSASVDAEGRIHVAAYESENADGLMVRYLRIE